MRLQSPRTRTDLFEVLYNAQYIQYAIPNYNNLHRS
jgi:hypothetical protein